MHQYFERIGYSLQSTHHSGPIGIRCVLESLKSGPSRLVDLVSIDDSELLNAYCRNAQSFRGITYDSLVVEQIDTGWLRGNIYYQILDLGADARTIGEVWPARTLDKTELWAVTSHMVSAIGHMHQQGAIHGAPTPSTMYLDRQQVRLSEFWWSHRQDELPHDESLSAHPHEMWTKAILPYLAPEVLAGSPPGTAADIYSLGATLFHLLSGKNHRNVAPMSDLAAYKDALLNGGHNSLRALRPDLDDTTVGLIQNMLDDDLSSRPDLSSLERMVKYLCRSQYAERVHPIEGWAGTESQSSQAFGLLSEIENFAPPASAGPNVGLTNRLRIGETIMVPGSEVPVVERWEQHGTHLMILSDDDMREETEFRVGWLASAGERKYAILQNPAEHSSTKISVGIVVRIVDENTVASVSDQELVRMMHPCMVHMRQCASGSLAEIELALGPFISAP